MRTDFAPIGDVNTTRSLARFATGTRFEQLPDAVRRQTRRLIIDCLGLGLGAGDEPDLPMLLDYADTLGGHEQATIWGTARRHTILNAALINGHLCGAFDMDDTYLSDVTAYHASPQTVPPALAVGEWLGLSGADFVAAVAVGYELSLRVILSLGKTYHRQRWYSVPAGGPFASAAACGRLLGLDETQMTYALGLGALQAGGVIEGVGTMAGPFQYGRTAAGGLTAALLAQRGFTASEDTLTGRLGVHQVYPSDRNLEMLTEGLGERWEMLDTGFKPYACGINMHASIHGLVQIHVRHAPAPAAVSEITLRVNPHVLVPTGLREPKVGREGKFSAYYIAAVALIDGAIRQEQFADARVKDPVVARLREKVEVQPDETCRRDEAEVFVRMSDGTVFSQHVQHAPGTAKAPMSDDELIAKARRFAARRLGEAQAEELLQTAQSVETLDNVGALARLTVPARP